MNESLTIWYISKYVTPPTHARVGSRGFFILEELVKLGHRCLLITSDANHLADLKSLMHKAYEDENCRGVHVRWARTLKYKTARDWRRILSWFHFEWRVMRMPTAALPKPDIVIASSLSLLSVISGVFFRYRYGAKLIFEVRDIWPLVLVEEGGFSRWNPLVMVCGVIERLGYIVADEIVGTMPNLSAHVAGVLGKPKSVRCIPMGCDPSAMGSGERLPADYVAMYLPRERFIVCHAGTIGVTNALDTLFSSARLMREDRRVCFLIVGDGYMKDHYQNLTADLENVVFAPRIPKEMVQSLLEQVDVAYFSTHPSKVLEYGQSLNKVIDYMIAGKPVVASFSGFPSMINEAGCGTFVAAGDPNALASEIRRMMRMSKEDLAALGSRGRDWVFANRRYETLATAYLEICRSLLHR
jgi:glycosyltransferase involved in cell wall biosynthesis